MSGKLFSYPENFRALKVLICSKYGGHDVKLDSDFQFGTTNLTKQFLSKFPLGKVPCVELDTGQLMDETNSMAWQLCPGEMTWEQDKEKQAEVIRWMTLAEVEVTPPACNWVYPVIGVLQQSEGMARGKQDLLKLLTQFNSELRLKTWLVGERMSLADICLACSLLLVFTHVMDQEIKDKLPHLTRWFNTVVNQKKVKEVLDQVEILELAAVKVKTSVLDSDGELEEKLEIPLKPELDSIKKTLDDKEALEITAGGDREAATPSRNPSHFRSPRLLSPSFFESGLELEFTSSPSPVKESTVVGFNLILDMYIDDELEKQLEKPLKPTLDSIKKSPVDKGPLECSAGGNTLSSINKQFEPTETELDLVQSDESPKTCSEHEEELMYWCKEDQLMVCPDCFIFGKHRLHTPLRNEEMR